MSFAVALQGGEADGAWFEDHALREAPEIIEVAVGSDVGPALLDLPDDSLELGEAIVRYRRASSGMICCRRGRGRGCHRFVVYEPIGG